MIDNRLLDNNNDNFSDYHQRHFSRMTGFPPWHNTNIDKVCQFLDEPTFKSFLEFGEQDKAYDIDYAHGLELDDEFGDPYGINRNGMDDTSYRFILKCHILAIKCNGTLPNLVQFVSAVLGCSENDVTLGMARHYTNTGQLVGEPDTILIKDINIENVNNDQLVPLLASQLQLAVAADKRVLNVNFYDRIPTNIFIGVSALVRANIKIPIPNDVNDTVYLKHKTFVGVGAEVHAKAKISFANNVNDNISITTPLHRGVGVVAHGNITINMNPNQ